MDGDGRETIGVAELAQVLGITARAIQKRAKKEGWPATVLEGQGGLRYAFLLTGLPAWVRAAVAGQQSEQTGPRPQMKEETAHNPLDAGGAEGRGEEIRTWLGAPARERAVALARRAVLKAAATWARPNGRSRTAYMKEFYGRLNIALRNRDGEALRGLGFREHEIPEVLAHIRRVSWQTAYRWQAAWEEARLRGWGTGTAGLARGYTWKPEAREAGRQEARRGLGARSMSREMEQFVHDLLVKGEIKLYPRPRAAEAVGGAEGPYLKVNAAALYTRLANNFARTPSLPQFRRWLNQYLLNHGEGLAAAVLPSWWRAHLAPKGGLAAENVTYWGQVWELDGTLADVMLKDGRHEILAAVDVYSRDALVEVEKHAKSLTVAKLLRQGLLAWGVPERIVIDRGKIFLSKHIEGACAALGQGVELCNLDPKRGYAPWQKPHVEAFFGSLAKKLFELLPWYIGHNPGERKLIEQYDKFEQVFLGRRGGKLYCEATADELRRVLSDWLAKVYRVERHRFADCRLGRSGVVWERQAHSPRRAPRVDNQELLDDLLAPGFIKRFNSGVVWQGALYLPDSAAGWEAAQSYAKRRVIFKPSLADVGRGTLWAAREDGTAGAFICRVDARLRGGLSLEEYLQATTRIIKARRRRRREAEKLPGTPGYDRELARMPLPKVVAGGFGQPVYEGAAYRELGAYDDRAGLRLVVDEAQAKDIERGAARLEEARQAREQSLEDLKRAAEVVRYTELVRREGRGELITGDDAQFMRFFEAGDEYRDLQEYFQEAKLEAATQVWRE